MDKFIKAKQDLKQLLNNLYQNKTMFELPETLESESNNFEVEVVDHVIVENPQKVYENIFGMDRYLFETLGLPKDSDDLKWLANWIVNTTDELWLEGIGLKLIKVTLGTIELYGSDNIK